MCTLPVWSSPVPGYPRPRSVSPTALAELAAALAVPVPPEFGHGAVSGVTHASESVLPGDLYAALPGSRHHGAEFIAAAARAGAVAVLTDPVGAAAAQQADLPAIVVPDPRAVLGEVAARVYGDPTRGLTVLGITGTAGKTSTAYLIEAGLRAAGRVTGLIGTVETRMGDLVLDSVRTTPEATDLQALLAVAVERGVDSVAMEVSSHALALGRVGGVRFRVGGFTNLGTDHLDFHADVEEYFQAKARLFDGRSGTAVINLDDEGGRRLLRSGVQTPAGQTPAGQPPAGRTSAGQTPAVQAPVVQTYSARGAADATWYATGLVDDGYAQRFVAHGPGGVAVPAGVSLPGHHNVANALLAIAVLVAVDVDPVVAAAAVAACPGAPGRMERVNDRGGAPGGGSGGVPGGGSGGAPAGVIGVVDYAHKPDAVVEVLAALRRLVRDGARLICVIGAGGDRDRGKRPVMGAAAARGADLVLVTDDNPRTEDPAAIRAQVLQGARDAGSRAGSSRAGSSRPGSSRAGGAEVIEVPDRRAAIRHAVGLARPGDVVAVLGKGHERGQEIAGRTYPFDDRVELADALRGHASAPATGAAR